MTGPMRQPKEPVKVGGMNGFTMLWLVWVAFGVILELYTLLRKAPGDTLSEQLWSLRDYGSGLFSLIIAFMLWAVYHFIKEGVSNG